MTTGERFLFWVALVNFFVFVAVSLRIGGDALNGFASQGRFYLGEHHRYTEVGRPIFIYSTIHAASLFITHPIGVVVSLKGYLRAREGD